MLAAFEKSRRADLARDMEGNLTCLATSEWQMDFIAEQWPDLHFFKIREMQ